MILSKMSDQLILIPTIGFVREGEIYSLVLSWLTYALAFEIFRKTNQYENHD